MEEINERINNVRGAVTMAYPMGLPEWDLVRVALDEPIDSLKVGDSSCCVLSLQLSLTYSSKQCNLE